MNVQFSFGSNRSYILRVDSVCTWSQETFPPGLTRLLQDPEVGCLHDVAFPVNAGLSYVACWKKARSGNNKYDAASLGPNYTRLSRFVKSLTSSGAHTLHTSFGPGLSYFSVSPSGYSSQNISPILEEEMHNNSSVRRPTCVALGVQGAYVALYSDGTVNFDLRGQYPLVEGMIRLEEGKRRRGITYIALNPFVGGEYYAVFGDGSASWNLPTVWNDNVVAVSRRIRPGDAGAQSSVAAPGGTSPVPTSSNISSVPVSSSGSVLSSSPEISPTSSASSSTESILAGTSTPTPTASQPFIHTPGATTTTSPPPSYTHLPSGQSSTPLAIYVPPPQISFPKLNVKKSCHRLAKEINKAVKAIPLAQETLDATLMGPRAMLTIGNALLGGGGNSKEEHGSGEGKGMGAQELLTLLGQAMANSSGSEKPQKSADIDPKQAMMLFS